MTPLYPRSSLRRGCKRSIVVGLLLSLVSLSFATRAVAAESFREWEARMAAFYEANPELKGEKGSGWKPYNRIKYFMEQRIQGEEEIPAGARWSVFLRKKEIESHGLKRPPRVGSRSGPRTLRGGSWISSSPRAT